MDKQKGIFGIAVLWFFFILILLTLPGSVLPKENWLDRIWADKWVHIILFGMLVVLWSAAFAQAGTKRKYLKKTLLLLMLLGIMYGIGMEFVQKYFIPHRSFDIGDIVADTIGSVTGFIYSSYRYIKK